MRKSFFFNRKGECLTWAFHQTLCLVVHWQATILPSHRSHKPYRKRLSCPVLLRENSKAFIGGHREAIYAKYIPSGTFLWTTDILPNLHGPFVNTIYQILRIYLVNGLIWKMGNDHSFSYELYIIGFMSWFIYISGTQTFRPTWPSSFMRTAQWRMTHLFSIVGGVKMLNRPGEVSKGRGVPLPYEIVWYIEGCFYRCKMVLYFETRLNNFRLFRLYRMYMISFFYPVCWNIL